MKKSSQSKGFPYNIIPSLQSIFNDHEEGKKYLAKELCKPVEDKKTLKRTYTMPHFVNKQILSASNIHPDDTQEILILSNALKNASNTITVYHKTCEAHKAEIRRHRRALSLITQLLDPSNAPEENKDAYGTMLLQFHKALKHAGIKGDV